MSGNVRICIQFILTVCMLSLCASVVLAEPSDCLSSSHTYNAPFPALEDGGKKLSAQEFGLRSFFAGPLFLQAGVELNVVIDTQCLATSAARAPGLEGLRKLTRAPVGPERNPVRSVYYRLDKAWRFSDLQSAFESEPCVKMVSPDRKFYLSHRHLNVSDPLQRKQVHLQELRFYDALPGFMLPMMVRVNPVTIAIVDTGVDFQHPDLKFNRWRNRGEIPGNRIDDDRNGYVDDVHGFNFPSVKGDSGPEGTWPENRHGTHVAGLAAARIDNRVGGIGVHGLARLMSLNVFGGNGFTRSSVLENAIRYAADEGAQIINLSLGGREYSRTMRSVLQYAISKGSFIVAAAGNDGIELCDAPTSFDFISPAAYGSSLDGMMVTGSVDVNTGRLSGFSNYSAGLVEISTPGAYSSMGELIGLLSTTPHNSYALLAGTSMAAPVLSGASALVYSWLRAYQYPISPQQLEKILKESARRERGLIGVVQEGRTVDLAALLRYLKENYPPRASPSLDRD